MDKKRNKAVRLQGRRRRIFQERKLSVRPKCRRSGLKADYYDFNLTGLTVLT
jgi:hypothetical protein